MEAFGCRLHLLTKHRVFSGPGFQVAIEVGDAANGGQVLLTHDAWLRLEPEMSQAGFPTVKQIGLYQLKSWPSPLWLYEVSFCQRRLQFYLMGPEERPGASLFEPDHPDHLDADCQLYHPCSGCRPFSACQAVNCQL